MQFGTLAMVDVARCVAGNVMRICLAGEMMGMRVAGEVMGMCVAGEVRWWRGW
jgi:hypothetical protein